LIVAAFHLGVAGCSPEATPQACAMRGVRLGMLMCPLGRREVGIGRDDLAVGGRGRSTVCRWWCRMWATSRIPGLASAAPGGTHTFRS
ncbi:hypothetical protein J4Q44_G00061230, partial [Coregonus suidteri]